MAKYYIDIDEMKANLLLAKTEHELNDLGNDIGSVVDELMECLDLYYDLHENRYE